MIYKNLFVDRESPLQSKEPLYTDAPIVLESIANAYLSIENPYTPFVGSIYATIIVKLLISEAGDNLLTESGQTIFYI